MQKIHKYVRRYRIQIDVMNACGRLQKMGLEEHSPEAFFKVPSNCGYARSCFQSSRKLWNNSDKREAIDMTTGDHGNKMECTNIARKETEDGHLKQR